MQRPLRNVPFDLSDEARSRSNESLQEWLPLLIASALRLKQAHWNLRGARFKSVHEQFDEILDDVRTAVDDVAERIVTLGGSADGLPGTVFQSNSFAEFPIGLLSVELAIDTICDDLGKTVQGGRKHLQTLSETDPISEDLVIGVVASLEKHHWLLHSQREL